MSVSFIPPSIIWPKTSEEAVAIQNDLCQRVRIANELDNLKIIAGIDVSYDIKTNLTRAFIVLLHYETLQPITSVKAIVPTTFPYIPGFLSFREIPAILEAMKQLSIKPDLLMVDGQGIAHPRHLGIAAHLGVLLDMPTIGVAKSRLVGHHREVGPHKDDYVPLMFKSEQVGIVLRSKHHVKPLYISPGHRVNHLTALRITQHCLTRYRLPEPTRLADKLSKEKQPEPALL